MSLSLETYLFFKLMRDAAMPREVHDLWLSEMLHAKVKSNQNNLSHTHV